MFFSEGLFGGLGGITAPVFLGIVFGGVRIFVVGLGVGAGFLVI